MKKYADVPEVNVDVVDIDSNSISIVCTLMEKVGVPANFHINYIVADSLLYDFGKRYDIVVGNPPYMKIKGDKDRLALYKQRASNKDTNNIFAFFIERMMELGDAVSLIVPKSLINAPEYNATRVS